MIKRIYDERTELIVCKRTKFCSLGQSFVASMRWYFLLIMSLSNAMGFHRSLVPVRLFSAKVVKTISRTKHFGTVSPGHVYFVATPIGNLQDITIRAKETLLEADYICAEDTRHTINLLRLLQIPHKQMISHHEHNHHSSIPYIVDLALSGKSIAVVSDAGTPGISDPGTELAAALAKANVPIHPVPGPSAVISALSISGFPCSPFTFYGFLPAKGTARKDMLKQIYETKHTLVLYEAPHRIQRTLQDIASYTPSEADNSLLNVEHVSMGSRVCVCCRELTKVHEQISRGTVQQVLQGLIQSAGGQLDQHKDNEEEPDVENAEDSSPTETGTSSIRSKGEFTLILGPVSARDTQSKDENKESVSAEERLTSLLLQFQKDGVRRSEAVALCVDMLKLSKRVVYAKALTISNW